MATILPIGGLCNRFRVILSFLQFNKTINVYWEELDDICNEHFLKIFKPIPEINFLTEKPSKYHYLGFNGKITNPYLYYKIIPQDFVKEKINYYLRKLGNNFNTCHIRRTDHVIIQQNTKSFIPDEVYIRFISISPYKVFLATDNIKTQIKFKSLFPSKVILNEEISETESQRKSTLDNAYIDLVICSLGKNFLGSSKWSTFTTTINTFRKINYWKKINT
jgi:hypothetical protein